MATRRSNSGLRLVCAVATAGNYYLFGKVEVQMLLEAH